MHNKAVIIGAGKIAFSLAPAMKNCGLDILQIISRSEHHARELARIVKAADISTSISSLTKEDCLVVISVPDSSIEEAARQISDTARDLSGKLFIHLSGSMDISSLKCLEEKGASIGSVHIMQSFPSRDEVSISNSYAAVEAGDKTQVQKELFLLAEKLGLHPFAIDTCSKAFYHLSGVYASNFIVGSYFNSENSFNMSGASDVNFYELISPLLTSTVNNLKNGAQKALSGPAERGDIISIEKHLNELKKPGVSAVLRLNYIAQSLSLLELVERRDNGLSRRHKAVLDLLRNELAEVSELIIKPKT